MSLPVFRALGHVLVIGVDEVIDIASAEHVRTSLVRQLLRARGQEASAVVVDLRDPCLTTAGVDVLADIQHLADTVALRLLVVAPHSVSRRVLRITEADRRMEVHPGMTAALRALGDRRHGPGPEGSPLDS
ncbi:STAS domain-containing protein [Streptomyces sp. NPDC046909]|uniref:STAS domain-containing protein n=1 Tax=Streptomyces sp. NPDC046909 TaxID=3155617 RepID=UPI00340AEB2F